MDPSIHWNIALCNLICPTGAPFMNAAGMPSICPLKHVTLFVLHLTRRNSPQAPSIYLPLSYDQNQNLLHVYIPPKMEATASAALPHLPGIDLRLKQFCEQFRAAGNPNCVIAPAIRHLLLIPNLMLLCVEPRGGGGAGGAAVGGVQVQGGPSAMLPPR